jgi:pre-mRNA-splicing factor ATP-dependent RNA helicase DHX16
MFSVGRQLTFFLTYRQVMEIKPAWLLEGWFVQHFEPVLQKLIFDLVAPHYFKPADLEQLAQGDKKMPKAIGISSSTPTPS